ncbi:MAG: hypothetical protein HY769_06865 [Candidatus Stahlbacteria bacterium]|nr:hypothetical protein [Candidatus Stahlbacteria bacterium]
MSKFKISYIDYALIVKAHTPMYLTHKYWARKPHNVVAEYIQHYTKEGDIVLDPYVGSGVAAVEAIKLGRKGIGIDLNPVATFITRMTAIPVDINKIKNAFGEIKKEIMPLVEKLYGTSEKNKPAIISHCIYKDKEENETLYEVWFKCIGDNKIYKRKPSNTDFKKLKEVERLVIKRWYPKNKLSYNGEKFKEGTHDNRFQTIDSLFTKRNLIILSELMYHIEKVVDTKTKDILRFAFTSNLGGVSRLVPLELRSGSTKIELGGWAIHRYWVPPIRFEVNAWNGFCNRIEKIINGKTDSNNQIEYYKEAKKFNDLNDGANIFLKTHNALELTQIIPKNSVDYVFTDPPYGGAIQYFELSTLWASWLKMDLNYNDEITINKNQDKDFEYYHKMLRASFKEIYQVLKPGKYMTVTFHSTDIKVWNSIIKAVVMVGFELEKIIYQPPARPSAKGLLQPYGSAVGDYYIRFRKPKKAALETEKAIDLNTYELEVIDDAQRIIGNRGEPTIYQHILNGIMADLQGGRLVPVGAKNIEDILKEHIGKEFELIPIKDEQGKTIGKKWWLKGVDISHFTQPTLSDRVERKVIEILEHNVKVSFDDIIQAIFIEFPNALTPETQDIKEVLQEYATQTKDGNWILKPQVKARESQHSEMIYYLALLGKKARLDVWIGQREQGQVYNHKRLSSFLTNKSPVWRYISSLNVDRVRQIDVIWHDGGRPRYEFEVEHTTAITEAIVRGSNIPQDRHIKRLIVIPEEREKLLFRKMKEPILSESIIKNNWKFLFYTDVKKVFEENRKNERIDLEGFEKYFKLPKERNCIQNSLFENIDT